MAGSKLRAAPKILIVDDEPFNVDYLEQELEGLDCEILSATNGLEALDQVRRDLPDLVLLDIRMPILDGFAVLAQMKADQSTREIPVIVISANNDLQSVVRGIEAGAEDYLPKPFEPVLLHARISSSLEKKRLRDLQQLYLKSLEREFVIAHDIQASFLPSELPEVQGWEIAAYFKAARDVAGDYYDAFWISNGSLACVIGDVCGKGVGAALFMTLFRSLIRSALIDSRFMWRAGWQALPPVEMLRSVIDFLNVYVCETHSEANIFSTVFIGILDPEDGKLAYINCGNEAPLVLANGSVVSALHPTGPVVGILPEACFEAREIVLEPGQALLAFTDGVPDALNEEGVPFGANRLRELLSQGETQPATLLQSIEAQLQRFMGSAHPFDDITVLAVHRNCD